jgi:hypothetical protein
MCYWKSARRVKGRKIKQWTHTWRWKKRLPERFGQLCRVLATGRLNSVLVEFENGTKVITSRYAVRKKNEFPRTGKIPAQARADGQ